MAARPARRASERARLDASASGSGPSRAAAASCSAAPCRAGTRRNSAATSAGPAPWAPEPGGQDYPSELGQWERRRARASPRRPRPTVPAGTPGEPFSAAISASSMSSTDGPPAVTASWRPRPSGLELRTTTSTPRPLRAGHVGPGAPSAPRPEVGVGGDGVGGQRAGRARARRRRRPAAVESMSPRLASAITSRPAARRLGDQRARARPGRPNRAARRRPPAA